MEKIDARQAYGSFIQNPISTVKKCSSGPRWCVVIQPPSFSRHDRGCERRSDHRRHSAEERGKIRSLQGRDSQAMAQEEVCQR